MVLYEQKSIEGIWGRGKEFGEMLPKKTSNKQKGAG